MQFLSYNYVNLNDYFKHSVGFLIDKGWGGKLSRAVYLAPHLEFQREWIICKFYNTIYYRNICWKRYKHYFSQSEMLTSNVQLGYILTRGGGQAVQGGLSCPRPRISKRMDNQQFLLHHLLQKYFAVLCPWERHFTPRKYWLITQEAVAPSRHDWKIVDWDVKPQHKQTKQTKSEIFSWERYKLYFSQSEMLTSNVQLGYVLTRGGGGGASCPGRFILPPAQNFSENR